MVTNGENRMVPVNLRNGSCLEIYMLFSALSRGKERKITVPAESRLYTDSKPETGLNNYDNMQYTLLLWVNT